MRRSISVMLIALSMTALGCSGEVPSEMSLSGDASPRSSDAATPRMTTPDSGTVEAEAPVPLPSEPEEESNVEDPELEPELEPEPESEPESESDPEGHLVFTRGFDREWLRTVLGFSVPHRLSTFHDAVEYDGGDYRYDFGQRTGVDGNFMLPTSYVSSVRARGIEVHNGQVVFDFQDLVSDGEYPRARTEQTALISGPDAAVLNSDPFGAQNWAVVLRGFRFVSTCDNADQPTGAPACNSDGFWPYELEVSTGACSSVDGQLSCPVRFVVGRAWTPNAGGVSGIEEKPLNASLRFRVVIEYALVGGNTRAFAATRGVAPTTKGALQDYDSVSGAVAIFGVPQVYPHAEVALSGFRFRLSPATTAASQGHLGRYIGGMRFATGLQGYDPASGVAGADYDLRVWAPTTTVASEVEVSLSPVLLQFGDPAAEITSQSVTSSLCVPSTEQAPAFSRWNRCAENSRFGPERFFVSEPLAL